MKNKTINDLTYELKLACSNGDLPQVKYLLTSPKLKIHAEINIRKDEIEAPLTLACSNGHLEIAKYLLTSTELSENAKINGEKGAALAEACWHGHLDIVKYLLTSPDLKEHANINLDDSQAINCAAANGHLEIVKYLLTSPDIKEHAKLSDDSSLSALVRAGAGNHIEIVKFLTSSKKLKQHPNEKAIERTFKNAFNEENLDILSYFILELNLPKTLAIEKFLHQNRNECPINEVNDFFQKRDLRNELNIELANETKNEKRIKI